MFSVLNIFVILSQILNRNLFVREVTNQKTGEGTPEPQKKAFDVLPYIEGFSFFIGGFSTVAPTIYKLDISNVIVVKNNALCEHSLALSVEILNEQTNTLQETHNTDRKRKLVIILPSEKKSLNKFFTILKYFKQFESWQGRLLGSRISYGIN